jgi:ABC-2 type transport system permease protein
MDLPAICYAVAIAVLLSFCISSLGIVIATFYESFESFSVIMNFIIMPMFFLSGAMYPVNKLPHVLQVITRLNPLTYGVDALKHILLGESGLVDFTIVMDITVLAVSSVVFVAAAGILFEKKK